MTAGRPQRRYSPSAAADAQAPPGAEARRLAPAQLDPGAGNDRFRLFVHEFRTEQLLFWRNRESAFFTFLLPVLFFLIFGSVYGNDRIALTAHQHVRAAGFLEAGMIGYGVAATCFAGLGITFVVRRESGVLKRIRATPLPAVTYLLAVLASTFLVFLIEAVLIIAIGRLLFSVAVPDRLFSLVAVLALGALAFAALGLGITGFVRSAEGSSAVINAVYLPMAIISGTFFSPRSYPEFLRVIAEILPLTHYTELTRDVMLDHDHLWSGGGAIAVVVVWGLIGLAAAARYFRWQPRES